MTETVPHKWLKRLEPRILPDRNYIKKEFLRKTGLPLDLQNPTTFNEKIQWLKLFYRNPILPTLADKIAVKEHISRHTDSKYLIPTFSIFRHSYEITDERVPSNCILKASHGSGWNQIVKSHSDEELRKIRRYFNFFLKKNYYLYSKEWAYKNVTPRILCEPLLYESSGRLPRDYKVFCFNGEPTLIQVDVDRFSNHTRAFYDTEWIKQDFTVGYPMHEGNIERPDPLEEILRVSATLSKTFPFLRVDFLLIDSTPVINELTLYPGNGMEQFSSAEHDRKLGEMLTLRRL